MIVMKFGGTSVEDANSIERVAEIIRERLPLKPVVVVSAMGKTTRKLLRAATASAAGDTRTCAALVVDLRARHKSEARRLTRLRSDLFRRLDEYFAELGKLLEGLAILREVPPRGLDRILSYGELLSSAIVADAFSLRRLPCELLDARELIRTDDHFGSANPIFEHTDRNLRSRLEPLLAQGKVPVLQGFIGCARDGATTTLGFEGSDYTAAIVGAALEASDIQIWKDVSGLMTADPAIFAGARTVKLCSYAEAAELTRFGAKVLHPKAILPAARRNIPVHIYNSKQPLAAGTLISAEVPPCTNRIKSIAYMRHIGILLAESRRLEDAAGDPEDGGFLRTLLDITSRRGLRPLLTSASASNAAVAFSSEVVDEERKKDLIRELSGTCQARMEGDMALISLVGNDLYREAGIAGRVLNAVEDLSPRLVLHGASPLTMNLLVAESQVAAVVARLHGLLFAELDPAVFE